MNRKELLPVTRTVTGNCREQGQFPSYRQLPSCYRELVLCCCYRPPLGGGNKQHRSNTTTERRELTVVGNRLSSRGREHFSKTRASR